MTSSATRLSRHSTVGRRSAERSRRIGDEIRRLRVDANLSQRQVAEAAGVGQSFLSEVERGLAMASLPVLEAIAVALGADLAVRLYPNAGPAIHDRTQAAMLEALLKVAVVRWRRQLEVVVHRPARGVIDAVLFDPTMAMAVAFEAESMLRRIEQQIRWANEKAESLPSSEFWRFASANRVPNVSRGLLLRVSSHNRELAIRYEQLLRASYPAPIGAALAALEGHGAWPGPVLLWAEVGPGGATLRSSPPRGVAVGR